jgi:hypothetical protein
MVEREQVAAEMNENAAEQEQFNFMTWPGSPFFYCLTKRSHCPRMTIKAQFFSRR